MFSGRPGNPRSGALLPQFQSRARIRHIAVHGLNFLPPVVIPPVPITRRRVLGMLSGAAAAVGVPTAWISSMKTYDGPVSDHFDGVRFFDPDGVPPKSLAEVLRWQVGTDRQRASWPEVQASSG